MLSIGTKIGQYKVLRVIAQTACSDVYLVYSEALESKFVIKMSKLFSDNHSVAQQQFLMQAAIMNEFSAQAHIVSLLHLETYTTNKDNIDVASDPATNASQAYIVMPFYQHDLAQYLALHQQTLSVHKSTQFILQLLQALHVLHGKGVVHGDIKPQNVLLDESETAYLADFDSAFITSASALLHKFPLAQARSKECSRAYASPEQLAALASQNQYFPELCPKSDLYSLAAMWFRMLTGDTLQDNDRESVIALLQATPHTEVPAWLQSLICDMLTVKIADRVANAEYCISYIQRFVGAIESYDTELATPDIDNKRTHHAANTIAQETPDFHGKSTESRRKNVILLPLLTILLVYGFWLLPSMQDFFDDNTNVQQATENNIHSAETLQPIKNTAANKTASEAPSSSQSLTDNHEASAKDKSAKERLKAGFPVEFVLQSHSSLQPPVRFTMQPIGQAPSFAVMQTEVTQALYKMCVEEGNCRTQKRFTTGKKQTDVNTADLPQVNVSWFEVNEAFIPWLQSKTSLQFSLPSLSQWQQLDASSVQNAAIYCKGCQYGAGSFYQRSTIPVKRLSKNHLGLYGVYGNAQEWLLNCWEDDGIQRCDQAMVAGGSWIDTRSKIQKHPVRQLLKRAASSTTGFRLVLNFDD